MKLWIEVGDLLHYLAHHNRPSGIQRVAFEICQALYRLDPGAVRFVHRGAGPREMVKGDWSRLDAGFRLIASVGAAPPAAAQEAAAFEQAAAPGDCFLVLGSPWMHQDYGQTVRWMRDDLRLRFALLMYDLIPIRHPEWCNPAVIAAFTQWHQSVLPLADQVFAISRATADDVVAWARRSGLALTDRVQPIPMGTGLSEPDVAATADTSPNPRLPEPGSYALIVSTLEARKNHALLFRIWRRLLDDLPRARVPTLVFAGRVGWLVADLMQQLENAAWLGGKIRLLTDPTDAELSALYRGCQFTLFPSLFEGWGLPVSESLALGRPCIISNRTSLPEAGGDLARYFDPESLEDAYRTVRAVIDDPAGLAAWQQRVAREFRPVSWQQSAEVIRDALAQLDAPCRRQSVPDSAAPERSPFFDYRASFDPQEAMRRHAVPGLFPTPGYLTNFLGVLIEPRFFPEILQDREAHPDLYVPETGRVEPIPIPANWHADIAEWGAALRAVDLARDRFTMIELGCGWGCWMNNAGVAARRAGLDVHVIGIEGDAGHLEFARAATAANGFTSEQVTLRRGIAAPTSGFALFPRQQQAGVAWGLEPIFLADEQQRRDAAASGQYDELPMIALEEVAAPYDRIDLLHIDIQGGEANFIAGCLPVLNRKVAYLLVGTHSRRIEGRIGETLFPADWTLEIERPAIFAETPAGPVLTVDGVQGWRNPRLAPR